MMSSLGRSISGLFKKKYAEDKEETKIINDGIDDDCVSLEACDSDELDNALNSDEDVSVGMNQ